MRTVSLSALFAFGLAVQQAAATGWTDANTYNNPYNTNNKCTDKQSKGLGFDDQPNGNLGNYGDLTWQNVQCTNGLSKRTFGRSGSSKNFAGGKCASGTASKDVNSSPKISCDSNQQGMSIDTMHVSSSEDTNLEFHYGYDNGQICKQTASCSKGGSVIKNSQCGGAKSVTVKLPDTDTKSNCEVGIHSVDFNCGPASSKPPVPSSTPVYSSPVSSIPQETKPYPIPTVNTTTTSAGPTVPVTTSQTTPQTTSETTPISSISTETGIVPTPSTTTSQSSSNSVYSTPVSSTAVETSPVTSSTGNSPTSPATTPGTTVPIVTTEVVMTTLTTCPVTNTVTSGSSTSIETTSIISTVFITSTSTVCTQCVPPVSTPSTSTIPESPVTTTPVPVLSSSNNSPESPTSSIPVPSGSTPAPVPTTTQAIVTTEVVYTTLTTCPVTSIITSGTSTSVQIVTTISTITSTSTSTICTQCVPPPPATGTPAPPPETGSPSPPPLVTTPAPSTGNSPNGQTSVPAPPASTTPAPSSPASSPPAPSPPAPCPTVLPNCMKTWITLTTCKDTSDSNCYCQDAGFTKTVQDCVSAWAASGDDVQGALSYLAGICAPHVAQNPGIITNVPKTVTLVPTPASPAQTTSVSTLAPASPATSGSGGNSPVGVTSAPVVAGTPGNSPTSLPAGAAVPPVTTLSLSQTVTYACPVSQLADGQPQAPASSSCTSLLNTQVTVPQVGFTTAPASPGASSPSVGLAAGSPAPVPASPTAGPGGNSPVGATTFGTVVGSASAIGSTKPPGSTGAVPFTGAASNTKVTSFGILAGVIGMLVLA